MSKNPMIVTIAVSLKITEKIDLPQRGGFSSTRPPDNADHRWCVYGDVGGIHGCFISEAFRQCIDSKHIAPVFEGRIRGEHHTLATVAFQARDNCAKIL